MFLTPLQPQVYMQKVHRSSVKVCKNGIQLISYAKMEYQSYNQPMVERGGVSKKSIKSMLIDLFQCWNKIN
jgi:hypothetical protein